jgi:hypothetical protein
MVLSQILLQYDILLTMILRFGCLVMKTIIMGAFNVVKAKSIMKQVSARLCPQWHRGRTLDSKPLHQGFESHRWHRERENGKNCVSFISMSRPSFKAQSRIFGHVDNEFCLFTEILLESLSMWGTSCQIPTCGSLFGQIGSCRIQYFSYAKIIFPAGFAGQGVLNKHPTVWLDNRLPPIS